MKCPKCGCKLQEFFGLGELWLICPNPECGHEERKAYKVKR